MTRIAFVFFLGVLFGVVGTMSILPQLVATHHCQALGYDEGRFDQFQIVCRRVVVTTQEIRP